ncbi:MAG: lycopene cyclase domain-containing protein [Candidatus Nanopelagicales bacterium]
MTYVWVLAFILVGSGWLELVLRTRVFRRWRRLLATLACAIAPFLLWDLYAIAAGHWWFDPEQLIGVQLPIGMPVEEFLFFPVVGLAAILTLEAVRAVRDTRAPADTPIESGDGR